MRGREPGAAGGPDVRLVAAALAVAITGAAAVLVVHDPGMAAWVVDEGHAVESAQVVLFAVAGVLTGRSALQARRAGEPVALDTMLTLAFAVLVAGEVDVDRQLAGVKVLSTRWLLDGDAPLAARLLVAGLAAGALAAVAALVVRWRHDLRRAVAGLAREPWGQVLLAAAVTFGVIQPFEHELNAATSLPRNFLEETIELVAATWFAAALLARPAPPPTTSRRRP